MAVQFVFMRVLPAICSSLCCNYTVQFELPAICSSLCCNYTVQFELPAICSSVLQLHCTVWTTGHLQLSVLQLHCTVWTTGHLQLCVATTLYSLNYRPSAALCFATTLYSLNYRPSTALCVATTLYSLNCFIWRSFLQEKNNGISRHHKHMDTQNDGIFVECVCAECKRVWCFLNIKQCYLTDNYVQRVWLSHNYLSATCRFISPRNTCNMYDYFMDYYVKDFGLSHRRLCARHRVI
jgi:hypothetical protein